MSDQQRRDTPSERWRELRGAPAGTDPRTNGWPQEAALRLLNNNPDPDVGEAPETLVVCGGTGQAARSWDAADAIIDELEAFAADETLLV
jgi:urocanate hydratase